MKTVSSFRLLSGSGAWRIRLFDSLSISFLRFSPRSISFEFYRETYKKKKKVKVGINRKVTLDSTCRVCVSVVCINCCTTSYSDDNRQWMECVESPSHDEKKIFLQHRRVGSTREFINFVKAEFVFLSIPYGAIGFSSLKSIFKFSARMSQMRNYAILKCPSTSSLAAPSALYCLLFSFFIPILIRNS